MEFKFGWKRDLFDSRDIKYKVERETINEYPKEINLNADLNSVYNQFSLGSCTANAIGAAIDFLYKKQKNKFINPSRLFIYYNERVLENTIKEDSGATIRNGIKTVAKEGVCLESTVPYDITKFTRKPNKNAYKEGLKTIALNYESIDNTKVHLLKDVLVKGFPIIFGFDVYESFLSESIAKNGILNLPEPKEKLNGGHAVLCIGYKMIDNKEYFIIRNSWSSEWGDNGNFYMPTEFITSSKLCADFWTISKLIIK